MRIYVNGRFLTHRLTGINRFAYEICKELNNMCDLRIITPNCKICDDYDVTNLKIIKYGKGKSHLWEQIVLPYFLYKQGKSILLSLSGIGPIIFGNKITTIHDLSFLRNKRWFSICYYLLYSIFSPLQIISSKKIITVSNFSKNEIINAYKCHPDKIIVVYNAVSTLEIDKCIKQKYVLTVGSLDPRKNLERLIEAFKSEELKDVELHIVGASNRVFKSFSIDPPANVKLLGRIDDKSLAKEYKESVLFVLPSLYEGFGIPPLEAISHGTDIAISDIPVFHEVFENSATYFNPYDVNDIARRIKNALNHPNKYDKEKKKVISKFSWKKSACIIKKVIDDTFNKI